MSDEWAFFFGSLLFVAVGGGLGTFAIQWLSEHGYLSGRRKKR